ncbi:MAG: hypothetical protein KDE50_02670 [Caldilineaceae bacterium]|nr:hypothetical protein [Caldilineaceae bacterium]MCB0138791.1 hypothetical protein [Caldilineaceae bacterium]
MDRICFYLAHFRINFVGLFCPLAELERRERFVRVRAAGTTRSQIEQVHAHQIYALKVDSAIESAQEIAATIKAYHERVLWPQAFRRIRNEKIIIDYQ